MDTVEDAIAVKHDLDSMQPKVLSPVEQDIIEGKPSELAEVLNNQLNQQERSHYSELNRVFLSSPSSAKVIEALHQGHSLHQAALVASVSINTARKVLAVLQKQQMSG